MYLLWQDLDPKKSQATKIAEAVQAYAARFKRAPNTVLMNAGELIDVAGMVVRSEGYIRRNILWIGWEDGAGKAADLAGAR